MSGTTPPTPPTTPPTSSTTTGDAVVIVDNVLKVGVGASGSFTTLTGQIVTVQNGIITNIF
jgi:hypothetical protein